MLDGSTFFLSVYQTAVPVLHWGVLCVPFWERERWHQFKTYLLRASRVFCFELLCITEHCQKHAELESWWTASQCTGQQLPSACPVTSSAQPSTFPATYSSFWWTEQIPHRPSYAQREGELQSQSVEERGFIERQRYRINIIVLNNK